MSGVATSLIYLIVVVAIGLPIWWKTTSPSRHALPEISWLMVHWQRLINDIPVTVVSGLEDERKFPDEDRNWLRSQLQLNWPNKFSPDGGSAYKFTWKVRQRVDEETFVFNKHQYNQLDLIDESLRTMGKKYTGKGKYFVFIVDDELVTKNEVYVLGANRYAYVSLKSGHLNRDGDDDGRSLAEIIVEVVEMMLEPKKSFNELDKEASREDSVPMERPSHLTDSTSLLLNQEMDIVLNIIAEDVDDGIKLHQPSANGETEIDSMHLLTDTVFLAQSGIVDLLRVKVTTQMVYYPFSRDFISSCLVNGTSTGSEWQRLFDTTHVPQFFTSIESRVVEHNNRNIYQIMVILPDRSNTKPLLFYDATSGSSSNTITTPYRGGALIVNDKQDFAAGLKALVRGLIGLPHLQSAKSLRRDVFFAKWELDASMRQVAHMQLAKTLSSLESISKLIDKVANIVIEERIAKQLHSAVELSHQSIDALANGELEEAYELSTAAYLASESAFFDPSLLALLYFPDDQKYAVYFPLFLPVSLPLVSSIYHLMKLARQSYIDRKTV